MHSVLLVMILIMLAWLSYIVCDNSSKIDYIVDLLEQPIEIEIN